MSGADRSSDPTESLAALPSAPPTLNGAAPAATCAGCGAPLAADQRYCLACGRPASPVRLAFLDVLQGEPRGAAHGAGTAPPVVAQGAAYLVTPSEPAGALGALRRYSGLLALLGVLLASLLIGLLVGHWVTGGGGSAPAKQVVEVKGLGGAALAAVPSVAQQGGGNAGSTAGSSGSGAGAESESGSEHVSAKQEAKEVKEVAAAKAPPVVRKKATAKSLQKLGKTTGKQHVKEVNELIKGDEPIETGH